MPKIVPDTLKPYEFHGVELEYRDSDKQAVGECPFCQRDGKFSVNLETGQFQCFVCREGTAKGGGNATVFVRRLHELSYEATKLSDYAELAKTRELLYPESLLEWGVARSILTSKWMIPGYNESGQLVTLYVYGDKLYPTPTLGHALMRDGGFDQTRTKTLYVCEGPWDGIALYEVLRRAKPSTGELIPTANPSASMLAEASVVAVPGCGSVGEPMRRWVGMCSGKDVILLFDNDHPREVRGRLEPGAGSGALRRAQVILDKLSPPARSVSCLFWGNDGWNPSLPSGYDVRDILTRGLNAPSATADAE